MKNILIAISAIFILMSCDVDKFLDVVPTGTKIPNTVEDFDKLMEDHQSVNSTWYNIKYMDPDSYLTDELYDALSQDFQRNQYVWSQNQYLDNEVDNSWKYKYMRIYVYNLILQDVDEAELGNRTEADRKMVKGQAYAQRAFDYFYLVNEYAPHYSAQSLSIPAIPMPLKPNLVAQLPRSTVEQVYKQIESDLDVAESLLMEYEPVDEVNFRPGLASIYGLRAWIALYKADFEGAKEYADKALDLYDVMYDYTTFTHRTEGNPWSGLTDTDMQYGVGQIDVLWYRSYNYGFYYAGWLYSPEAAALFDHDNDYRFKMFASQSTYYGIDVSPNYVYARFSSDRTVGVTTPDLLLISAEAHARTGNADMAVERLNTLLEKRILNFMDLTSADFAGSAELLDFIKTERRKEFFATGKTWFDFKRYHAYGENVPVFTRTVGGETYTLEPGSDKYVVPISPKILNQNPNL